MGRVLGAGSFGVVREVVHRKTERHYACKTVPKIPKRGNGTPRYLLKLQTEVDAMQQLGSSFDAVHLKVGDQAGKMQHAHAHHVPRTYACALPGTAVQCFNNALPKADWTAAPQNSAADKD